MLETSSRKCVPVNPKRRQLLETFVRCVDETRYTQSRYGALMRASIVTHPVPFFGDIETAKVLTVGVNPSITEFVRNDYPREISHGDLYQRYLRYFSAPRQPHPWFCTWEEILRMLGHSYASGTAAHIDLSPRPTELMRHCPPATFLAMVFGDAQWFWRFLSNCWDDVGMLLLAGTVTKLRYMDQVVHESAPPGFQVRPTPFRPLSGKGHIRWFSISHKNRSVPAFFCSSGPSAGKASLLPLRVRENQKEIAKHLNGMSERKGS